MSDKFKYQIALFSSRTRVKLLSLFLNNDRFFYVREISRVVDERLNSVRRELENLVSIDFLDVRHDAGRVYYKLSQKFPLTEALRDLFVEEKSDSLRAIFDKIKKCGQIKSVYFSGTFTTNSRSPSDILIVGEVEQLLIIKTMEQVKIDVGEDIRYTIMKPNDFALRKSLGDIFLSNILYKQRHFLVEE